MKEEDERIALRAGHSEQVKRWAEYVRTHKDWKLKLKPFIDSQYLMSRRFYKKLAETEEGREKIKLLRELRNKSQDFN